MYLIPQQLLVVCPFIYRPDRIPRLKQVVRHIHRWAHEVDLWIATDTRDAVQPLHDLGVAARVWVPDTPPLTLGLALHNLAKIDHEWMLYIEDDILIRPDQIHQICWVNRQIYPLIPGLLRAEQRKDLSWVLTDETEPPLPQQPHEILGDLWVHPTNAHQGWWILHHTQTPGLAHARWRNSEGQIDLGLPLERAAGGLSWDWDRAYPRTLVPCPQDHTQCVLHLGNRYADSEARWGKLLIEDYKLR